MSVVCGPLSVVKRTDLDLEFITLNTLRYRYRKEANGLCFLKILEQAKKFWIGAA